VKESAEQEMRIGRSVTIDFNLDHHGLDFHMGTMSTSDSQARDQELVNGGMEAI